MRLKTHEPREHDVLRSLFENQSAWDAGHEMPHQILGIGTGGGMECMRVAAICESLQEFGLTHPFTALITVSGAGGAVGGYLSGLAHRTPSIFEYLAVSGFMFWDFWLKMYRIRMSMLERTLNGETTPFGFDQDKINKHPSSFFVTATRRDGTRKLLNTKTVKPNAARAVCASSAMPPLCAPVYVDDEPLVDGVGGGNALPVEDGLALLGPFSPHKKPKVLVMQSRMHPKYRMMEWWLWPMYANAAFYWWMEPLLRMNIAMVDTCFATDAEKLSLMRNVDSCRIAPTPDDIQLQPYTSSLYLLRSARDETRGFMRETLTQARPVRHV